MIGVAVQHTAAGCIRRDDYKGDARPVAEEIQRLDVAGIPIPAAFVEGDEDRRLAPEVPMRPHGLDDLAGESLEDVELGARWMTVRKPTRLYKGHRRQARVDDVVVEVRKVGDMRGALGLIGHYRRSVLQ